MLPWRARAGKKPNPYHILVSETMLQQTQVDRVIPKYRAFLKRFPTIKKLAVSTDVEVLKLWQGLGYNRRARNLRRTASLIVEKHHGVFPKEFEELTTLPGIGPYTAAAIRVFAFNIPETMIETNIRAAYLHAFFPRSKKVTDQKLRPLIERTIDTKNPREWYAALMDYGSMLKRTLPNPSRRSAGHKTQTTFRGSNRYIRGQILKILLASQTASNSFETLRRDITCSTKAFQVALEELIQEGFISKKGTVITLTRN